MKNALHLPKMVLGIRTVSALKLRKNAALFVSNSKDKNNIIFEIYFKRSCDERACRLTKILDKMLILAFVTGLFLPFQNTLWNSWPWLEIPIDYFSIRCGIYLPPFTLSRFKILFSVASFHIVAKDFFWDLKKIFFFGTKKTVLFLFS